MSSGAALSIFDIIKFCVPLSCGLGVARLVVHHFGISYSQTHHYGPISFSVTFFLAFGLWKCYTEISYYRYKKKQREQERATDHEKSNTAFD